MITAILFQKNSNDVLRFVVFMLQKMLSVECNYEIYNKKFLAIVKAFEKWRFEYADIAFDYSIKILSDYKNFEHFMIIKQLNYRQTRWVEFLIEFNF